MLSDKYSSNPVIMPTEPGMWHRRPGDPKNYKKIWINPCWHDYVDLPYANEPFNNVEDIEKWRDIGYTQQRFTGDMYDMRNPEPGWIESLRQILPLKYFSWSIYRMRPGDVLPTHSDLYTAFRRINDIDDHAIIRRYVIFLEDWQSGHYLEIDGDPIIRWNRGTTILWHGDTPHLAANNGVTMRYTLQITGLVDPEDQSWRLYHANDSIFK
jgi:hypothetical protein